VKAAPEPNPNPAAAEIHHKKGRALLQGGNLPAAIAELSEAIRLAPAHALALNARAYAYLRTRQFELALADADAAIRLNPQYANAYQNRAAIRRALGNAAGAAEDAARAQSLLR
jgi:tetratricopeptide (TPR) repeat protein